MRDDIGANRGFLNLLYNKLNLSLSKVEKFFRVVLIPRTKLGLKYTLPILVLILNIDDSEPLPLTRTEIYVKVFSMSNTSILNY